MTMGLGLVSLYVTVLVPESQANEYYITTVVRAQKHRPFSSHKKTVRRNSVDEMKYMVTPCNNCTHCECYQVTASTVVSTKPFISIFAIRH